MEKIRQAYKILQETDDMIRETRSKIVSLSQSVNRGQMSQADISKRLTSILEVLNKWDEE